MYCATITSTRNSIGPRFVVFAAALEMHPLNTDDRLSELKQAGGIGYCSISKYCTKAEGARG
jgi:succinate dehydrogenase iron-sulfur subunit